MGRRLGLQRNECRHDLAGWKVCRHRERREPTDLFFELKLDRSAEKVLKQIDWKDYPARFALSGLPIVKVGISFDSEHRTLRDWEIESL